MTARAVPESGSVDVAVASPAPFEDLTQLNLRQLRTCWAPGAAAFLALIVLGEWWRKRPAAELILALAAGNRGRN